MTRDFTRHLDRSLRFRTPIGGSRRPRLEPQYAMNSNSRLTPWLYTSDILTTFHIGINLPPPDIIRLVSGMSSHPISNLVTTERKRASIASQKPRISPLLSLSDTVKHFQMTKAPILYIEPSHPVPSSHLPRLPSKRQISTNKAIQHDTQLQPIKSEMSKSGEADRNASPTRQSSTVRKPEAKTSDYGRTSSRHSFVRPFP